MGAMTHFPLVIIGSGPGGLAASATVASLGVRTLVVDEADAPGGQVYRDFPLEFEARGQLAKRREYQEREALVTAVSKSTDIVRWQDALFWGVDEDGALLIAREEKLVRIRYDSLIVAPGAYDRTLPFPGWTLPGVISVGGAYRLVRTQGVLPGKRVLVAGTGPLLLVLAEALIQAGAKIVAVVDSARSSVGPMQVLALMSVPSLCMEALRLKSFLRRNKVPVYKGWGIVETRGNGSVREVLCAPFTEKGVLDDRANAESFEPDAVAVGYGLISRTAVFRLLGAQMYYDEIVRDYIPHRSEDLETSVQGVFAVGDGARVSGKLVAREEGVLAGLAAAKRLNRISDSDFSQRSAQVRSRLKRLYRFRTAVDKIYRLPEGLFDVPADDTVVCRCEEVTAGEIRQAVQEGTLNLNDIKRRVRSGSGWCQGRTCGPVIAEMLAREPGVSQEEIFRMTQRPPSKPIPLSMLLEDEG